MTTYDKMTFGDLIDIRIEQMKRHIERCNYVLHDTATGKRNDLSDKDYDGICERIAYLEESIQKLEDSREAWLSVD